MAEKRFQFKRILCPVDFSPASSRALDLAIRLALLHGARIRLLHVIPRIVASLMDIPIATSKWTAAQEEIAGRELPKLKDRAAKAGISATTEITIGDVDLQILKAAHKGGHDLLALGSHGRRGFERWALGSVADRVMRHSPIPVLLTGSRGSRIDTTIRSILVSSDFSGGTRDAVGYAVNIARKTHASITMLHVLPKWPADVDLKALPDHTAELHKKLEALIPSSIRQESRIDTCVVNGEPYREILKIMEKSKPSLVILNTHGHGFINRILMGSTAERVVRGGAALSPLLIIPPGPGRSRASTNSGRG